MSTTIHPDSNENLATAKPQDTKKRVRDGFSEAAEKVRDSAERTASQVANSTQESYDYARGSLAKAGQEARDLTERQPLLVVGGALLVGVALGLAINSNRRN